MARYETKGAILGCRQRNDSGRAYIFTWIGLVLGDTIYWLPTKESEQSAQKPQRLRNLDLDCWTNDNVVVLVPGVK